MKVSGIVYASGMEHSFDSQNEQHLVDEISRALAKASAKGVESLTERERALLLQVADSVDNAALTLGTTSDNLMHQAGKDPEGLLSGLQKLRGLLSRRGKTQ